MANVKTISALFLFLMATCYLSASSPDNIKLKIEIEKGQKDTYLIGDTIQVLITAVQTGKYCNDGINKIRLFVRGLNITEKNTWEQPETGIWTRHITVVVTGNKSKKLQLTAYRNTDKGEVIETLNLKMKE